MTQDMNKLNASLTVVLFSILAACTTADQPPTCASLGASSSTLLACSRNGECHFDGQECTRSGDPVTASEPPCDSTEITSQCAAAEAAAWSTCSRKWTCGSATYTQALACEIDEMDRICATHDCAEDAGSFTAWDAMDACTLSVEQATCTVGGVDESCDSLLPLS